MQPFGRCSHFFFRFIPIHVFLFCWVAHAAALDIRFLDVGQGDAVLIQSGGKSVLVDTGPTHSLYRRLHQLGVTQLDMLLVSHNHLDHLGGAVGVLTGLPVRFFLDNGKPANTEAGLRVLEAVKATGVTYLRPTYRTLNLGSVQLKIIPPPGDAGGDEQNNQSVALLIERPPFRALLTGDSEWGELQALLRTGHIPHVQVLKAAHHGSANGVNQAWLDQTDPADVMISVGADNRYGHPGQRCACSVPNA